MDQADNGRAGDAAGWPGGQSLERLRRVPLFQGLGDAALRRVLSGAAVRGLADGGILFLQGEPADRFYVLLEGWVRLYRLTEDGAQAIVTVVAPGETFAEAAVFASGRYPVCAEAAGPATVLAIQRRAVTEALAAEPEIALMMLASLSQRLRHLVGRIEQLQVKSAPQRLALFLAGLCGDQTGAASVDLPFAKALLAQRLGMRPETLSRALASLRAHGVTVSGTRVTIADVARLRGYGEGAHDGNAAKAMDGPAR